MAALYEIMAVAPEYLVTAVIVPSNYYDAMQAMLDRLLPETEEEEELYELLRTCTDEACP